MSVHSIETLQMWIDEFRASREGGERITVTAPDGSERTDAGLVAVSLRDSTATMTLQPSGDGDGTWSVSVLSQPDTLTLSASKLDAMAAEFLLAAALCQFLAMKSTGTPDPGC